MISRKLKRPLLCLVTDPNVPGLVEKVESALQAGISMLQLRGHTLSAAQLYQLALALRPRCQHYGASFIVNDRLDVGLAVQADGFQLGERSLPIAAARQIVGNSYLLGASVHTLDEARTAIANGADFLLAGTIFASSSHPGGPTSGLNLLRAIKQECPCPLLAIGGITPANAQQVIEAGADGVAVISAILSAADIAQAVKAVHSSLDQAMNVDRA